MSVPIGKASVKNADGTVAFTGVLATVNKLLGLNLTDEWETIDLRDGDNQIFGRCGSNRQHKMSIEVVFFDPTTPSTLAAAKTNTKLPATMFATITLASTGITFIDGDWNYDGGSYAGRAGEYHKLSLNLWRGGSDSTPAALPAAS